MPMPRSIACRGRKARWLTRSRPPFPGTTDVTTGVNRGALAERVLAEPEELRRLEALIHPAVAAERDAFIAAHAEAPLIVLDIPLLFERGLDSMVDKVAVVSADPEVQRLRTLARPGMTAEKFLRILSHQMPDAEKRRRADFIIPTDCSFDETKASVDRIVACLSGMSDS